MPPKRYRIAISQRILDQLNVWARQFASDLVIRRELVATIHELNYRLGYEADEWGESREPIPSMGLEIRVGTCRLLTVTYGIHDNSKTVIVKSLKLKKPS